MKFLIIYFFVFTSIFAQDSSKTISNINNIKFGKVKYGIENSSIPSAIKPIIKMPVNRNWARNKIKTVNDYKTSNILKITKREESFIDSELFIITVGSAIVFGAAAAYLKLESDKNYDKYLSTKNKKYYDKTNQFDLYSGISLGIMEINFGYLIYKFLTD